MFALLEGRDFGDVTLQLRQGFNVKASGTQSLLHVKRQESIDFCRKIYLRSRSFGEERKSVAIPSILSKLLPVPSASV